MNLQTLTGGAGASLTVFTTGRRDSESGQSSCPVCVWQTRWKNFSIGTVPVCCMVLMHYIWLNKQRLFQY